jgi:hypothetical protein
VTGGGVSAILAMIDEAANDGADADTIRVGFATLRRCHEARARFVRGYLCRVVLVQGVCVASCAFVGVCAWIVGMRDPEPSRTIMQACAALNGATVLITLRNAAVEVRDALGALAHVRRLLAEVDAFAAAYEAGRAAAPRHGETPPAPIP